LHFSVKVVLDTEFYAINIPLNIKIRNSPYASPSLPLS